MDTQLTDVRKENATCIWSQLLIETLLRMPNSDTAKDELLNTCEQQYYGNALEFKNVQEFRKDYQSDKAIFWYTKSTFLYRLINKAIRTNNIDVIFSFRLFIKDLYNELLVLHQMLPKQMTVYRGQLMTKEELNVIQNSINGLISMNTFLSTSTTYDVAYTYAESCLINAGLETVLFQIEVDTTIDAKPYAGVIKVSNYEDENEVLFSMGTTFSIDEVISLENDI
ncbi:unnamed protein product [Didymodactylos carnosus]|uniref:NAD(P)(+)--arginine ADP-ribosyltransferase n=1 Tax=Didymodactylos carnosus TaxID=1234261 RepID=A0A815R035_9BILA|nr:unnamed protein product [Didymodactylos carnosus]CAF1470189.1 unnamed protein product [Didymodactylos carnosus]CAF4118354.1 unnamed protein product [Didymodactylos carnosus]CAF4338144.1 unnamed protein product [Didymodactylos carnosus]